MHISIFLLITTAVAAFAANPTPINPNGPFFLGRPCDPLKSVCLLGAQCYAANSNQTATCGNYKAACTSDFECATNSCVNGFCTGPVAGNFPLGTSCYESAQCAGGAECYAVIYYQYPSCGNFQSACTTDAQCAFNACENGFCTGMKPNTTSASITTSSSATTTVTTTGTVTGPGASSVTLSVVTTTLSITTSSVTLEGNSTLPTTTSTPISTTIPISAGEILYACCGGYRAAVGIASALFIVFWIL